MLIKNLLEIAELTDKQHKNLMRDIRNMEPAWEKTTGLKFELCERTYQLTNGVNKTQPFYSLSAKLSHSGLTLNIECQPQSLQMSG